MLEIICFDMEAAVILDQFSAITVRGISDYCDGHKNDDWHDYAALSAAVCAKRLLGHVNSDTLKKSRMNVSVYNLQQFVTAAIDAVQQDIKSAGSIDEIGVTQRALDVINDRLSVLDKFTKDHQDSNMKLAADDISNLKNVQEELKKYVDSLGADVKQKANKADVVTRQEWKDLEKKVDNTAHEVRKIKIPTHFFQESASIAYKAAEVFDQVPIIYNAAKTLETVGQALPLVVEYGGELYRRIDLSDTMSQFRPLPILSKSSDAASSDEPRPGIHRPATCDPVMQSVGTTSTFQQSEPPPRTQTRINPADIESGNSSESPPLLRRPELNMSVSSLPSLSPSPGKATQPQDLNDAGTTELCPPSDDAATEKQKPGVRACIAWLKKKNVGKGQSDTNR